MKLYEISDSYLDYLKSFDNRVLNRLGEKYRHTRKYLGILIKINDCNYIAPLSSPRKTDYLNRAIRKSIIPIVRIIKSKSGETTLLG